MPLKSLGQHRSGAPPFAWDLSARIDFQVCDEKQVEKMHDKRTKRLGLIGGSKLFDRHGMGISSDGDFV
jgi:hypothetical protein